MSRHRSHPRTAFSAALPAMRAPGAGRPRRTGSRPRLPRKTGPEPSLEEQSVAAFSAMGFLKGLLIRLGITAAAFWLATLLIPGITLDADSATETVTTLVFVAAIFGVVNAVLQPIIKTVGCGLYLLTLGLIALVVNGLLFQLTSWIAGEAGLPFNVDGFWPAAVLGALFVGVVTWLLGAIFDRD